MGTRRSVGRLGAVVTATVAVLAAGFGTAVPAAAAFPLLHVVVTTTTDGANSNSGDTCVSGALGCTLRAAVEYANKQASATSPSDVIITVPAGDYQLTIQGTPQDALLVDDASNGDLHLRTGLNKGKISLAGAGADSTFITQTVTERVIKVDPNTSAEIRGVTIRGGSAQGSPSDLQSDGGGIEVCGGAALDLHDAVVAGNQALTDLTVGEVPAVIARGDGGGISILGANSCTSELGGGASSTTDGTATIRNVVIKNNSADNEGGGIYNLGNLDIAASTVAANHATGNMLDPLGDPEGGGIFNGANSEDLANVVNVTITQNTTAAAGSGGGGFYALGGSVSDLTNVTLDGNTSGAAGGGGLRIGDTKAAAVNVKNTIIADNTGGNCAFDAGEAITDLGYNLDSADDCGFTAGANDIIETDPTLKDLAITYGTTPTMTPQPGSAAIDAIGVAKCPPPGVDQRGIARPHGALCDIGAVEVVQPRVDEVSPQCGPSGGGTLVTITGTGFTLASAVNFGTTPATNFTVVSDTRITAMSPPGSESPHVEVVGIDGSSNEYVEPAYLLAPGAIAVPGHFTYGCPTPELVVSNLPNTADHVSPTSDPALPVQAGLAIVVAILGAAVLAQWRDRRRSKGYYR
ncbi:MAG: hypothetical protein QOE92_1507 [Chloroflexota bacterium]|nr:hypothetical protein [Chloroflexota bacterium]